MSFKRPIDLRRHADGTHRRRGRYKCSACVFVTTQPVQVRGGPVQVVLFYGPIHEPFVDGETHPIDAYKNGTAVRLFGMLGSVCYSGITCE